MKGLTENGASLRRQEIRHIRLENDITEIRKKPLGAKITIATLKNRLSLNFTLRNIESAANSIKKTIAAHAWVHLPFPKVLVWVRLR